MSGDYIYIIKDKNMGLRKFIANTLREYLNESYDDIWYHGSEKKIERFVKMSPINRRGNTEGFYFTRNIDYAKSYGDEITVVKLKINNPFVIGESNVSKNMIRTYAIELHKENDHLPLEGSWIKEKCEYFKDKKYMPYTGLNGLSQQIIYKSGGFDSVIDGDEICVFDSNDIIVSIMREYINEQENSNDYSDVTLYHGTSNDFDEFDIEKAGSMKYSDWGKGIYFTRSKSMANGYRIDAIKKYNKEYNDAYNEYEQVEKELANMKYRSAERNELENILFDKLKKFQNIGRQLDSAKEGRLVTAKIKPNAKIYKYNSSDGMTDPYLSKEVKSKGYDIILVDENRYTEEFVVLNPDVIIITGEIKD